MKLGGATDAGPSTGSGMAVLLAALTGGLGIAPAAHLVNMGKYLPRASCPRDAQVAHESAE